MNTIVRQSLSLAVACVALLASSAQGFAQGRSGHGSNVGTARQTSHSSIPVPNRQRSVRAASFGGATQQTPMLAPAPTPSGDISLSAQHLESNFQGGPLGCDTCGMQELCCCNPAGFLFDWTRADLWIGVSSFAGQSSFLTTGDGTDGQVEGNFGFQEGFNFGSRMPSLLGGQIGAQIGMRFTHTQLDGTAAAEDQRTQTFLTAGLFRRVDYGLQGGLVVDYLHDDWVYQADLLQLRGELSFLFSACQDFGFRFTDSQQIDDSLAYLPTRTEPIPIQLSALNNYRFFYRYRFGNCGQGLSELQAGFTEDSGGILGLQLKTPLQNQLGLEANATYVLPPNDAANSFSQEGWNIGMAIVWTPGRVFGTQRDYYRPLMEVADNGNFLSRFTP